MKDIRYFSWEESPTVVGITDPVRADLLQIKTTLESISGS
jgi:hypothetical protein